MTLPEEEKMASWDDLGRGSTGAFCPECGGDGKVAGLKIERTALDGNGSVTGTGEFREFAVQAVYRAVGYFGSELSEIPFDARHGVIPNAGGRVLDSSGSQINGVYATGWIKRGPVGLIGHTKSDALETITNIIEDRSTWWAPAEPGEEAIIELLTERGVEFIDWSGWLRIDAQERALGDGAGRERIKLVERDQMIAIAKG